MAETWHIGRRTRQCAKTGNRIEPGQGFYSALVEKEEDFERLDFSAEAWPEVEKEGLFSYWKNKPLPEQGESRKPQVDFDRLLSFFDSLDGSVEPGRRLFRYVLALVFVRRRIFRLDEMSRTEDGDRLVVHDRRDGGRALEIVAPEATRAQLEAVQEKLSRLFEYDDAELE